MERKSSQPPRLTSTPRPCRNTMQDALDSFYEMSPILPMPPSVKRKTSSLLPLNSNRPMSKMPRRVQSSASELVTSPDKYERKPVQTITNIDASKKLGVGESILKKGDSDTGPVWQRPVTAKKTSISLKSKRSVFSSNEKKSEVVQSTVETDGAENYFLEALEDSSSRKTCPPRRKTYTLTSKDKQKTDLALEKKCRESNSTYILNRNGSKSISQPIQESTNKEVDLMSECDKSNKNKPLLNEEKSLHLDTKCNANNASPVEIENNEGLPVIEDNNPIPSTTIEKITVRKSARKRQSKITLKEPNLPVVSQETATKPKRGRPKKCIEENSCKVVDGKVTRKSNQKQNTTEISETERAPANEQILCKPKNTSKVLKTKGSLEKCIKSLQENSPKSADVEIYNKSALKTQSKTSTKSLDQETVVNQLVNKKQKEGIEENGTSSRKGQEILNEDIDDGEGSRSKANKKESIPKKAAPRANKRLNSAQNKSDDVLATVSKRSRKMSATDEGTAQKPIADVLEPTNEDIRDDSAQKSSKKPVRKATVGKRSKKMSTIDEVTAQKPKADVLEPTNEGIRDGSAQKSSKKPVRKATVGKRSKKMSTSNEVTAQKPIADVLEPTNEDIRDGSAQKSSKKPVSEGVRTSDDEPGKIQQCYTNIPHIKDAKQCIGSVEKLITPVPGVSMQTLLHISSYVMTGFFTFEPNTSISRSCTTNTAYIVLEGVATVKIRKTTSVVTSQDKKTFVIPKYSFFSISNNGDSVLKLAFTKFNG